MLKQGRNLTAFHSTGSRQVIYFRLEPQWKKASFVITKKFEFDRRDEIIIVAFLDHSEYQVSEPRAEWLIFQTTCSPQTLNFDWDQDGRNQACCYKEIWVRYSIWIDKINILTIFRTVRILKKGPQVNDFSTKSSTTSKKFRWSPSCKKPNL